MNAIPGDDDKDDVDHEDDGGEKGGKEGNDHCNGAECPGDDVPAGSEEGEYQGEEGKRAGYRVYDERGCDGFGDDVGGVGVDMEKLE